MSIDSPFINIPNDRRTREDDRREFRRRFRKVFYQSDTYVAAKTIAVARHGAPKDGIVNEGLLEVISEIKRTNFERIAKNINRLKYVGSLSSIAEELQEKTDSEYDGMDFVESYMHFAMNKYRTENIISPDTERKLISDAIKYAEKMQRRKDRLLLNEAKELHSEFAPVLQYALKKVQ